MGEARLREASRVGRDVDSQARAQHAQRSLLNEREEIPVDRPGVRGAHGVGKALIGLQGHRVQRFGAERSRVRIRNDLVALQLGRFSVLGVARP